MARLTITMSDARHRALKQAAAERRVTIGQLIEASLEMYGIKTTESARALVARARRAANMAEEDAVALAIEVTDCVRND